MVICFLPNEMGQDVRDPIRLPLGNDNCGVKSDNICWVFQGKRGDEVFDDDGDDIRKREGLGL